MTTQRALLGSMVLAMFALAMFIAVPLQAEEDAQAGANEPAATAQTEAAEAHKDDVEARTLTGVIVDVHAYLIAGQTEATDEDRDLLSFFAPEAPIAIRVDETTLAKKLKPGGTTYLIMFDPGESSGRDVYAEARKLVGKSVAVTGKLHERDGLHAISILGVHTVPEQAAADDERTDGSM